MHLFFLLALSHMRILRHSPIMCLFGQFCVYQGIVRAFKDYQDPLKEHEVTIFVRRGGPNYQEGLRVMGEVGMFVPMYKCTKLNTWSYGNVVYVCSGKTTGIPIHVFGTETHMTAIVGMALGHRPIATQPRGAAHTANFLLNTSGGTTVSGCVCAVFFFCGYTTSLGDLKDSLIDVFNRSLFYS